MTDDRNDPPTGAYFDAQVAKAQARIAGGWPNQPDPPPHVKVTEIARGRYSIGFYTDARIEPYPRSAADVCGDEIGPFVPDEAKPRGFGDGPVGRFRIVCEFWPEAPK